MASVRVIPPGESVLLAAGPDRSDVLIRRRATLIGALGHRAKKTRQYFYSDTQSPPFRIDRLQRLGVRIRQCLT